MSHQLFKHDLSQNILIDFLNENCEKTDSYYSLDKCAFKNQN